MFVLGLKEGFNEEPDKFVYFFVRVVFGNFYWINLVADLLVEIVAPEVMDGLD